MLSVTSTLDLHAGPEPYLNMSGIANGRGATRKDPKPFDPQLSLAR